MARRNIIRANQRIITATFPHQGNRRFIVPNRGKVLTPGPTQGEPKPGASG